MATLTPLPLDDARRIGARYGLSVAAVRGIPAGSVNSNYELALAGGGRVFLRVYEEQGAASAAGEARLLDHLAAHGVPTPRPLALADAPGFIAAHAGKPVALFPWVDGDSLCQARVTPEATFAVGEALGRVHAAGASFDGAPKSRFGVPQLEERIRRIRGLPHYAELARIVDGLEARLAGFASRDPDAGPSGLVHGDLFRDNVLWSEGTISALLDFESASRESYPFDLMVTLLAWCFGGELDRDLCRALVAGYARGRAPIGLPEAEIARLYDEGRFAALRFTITRITDFELRPRGSGVYKDFRRFLRRLETLEALGAEGLRAFLSV